MGKISKIDPNEPDPRPDEALISREAIPLTIRKNGLLHLDDIVQLFQNYRVHMSFRAGGKGEVYAEPRGIYRIREDQYDTLSDFEFVVLEGRAAFRRRGLNFFQRLLGSGERRKFSINLFGHRIEVVGTTALFEVMSEDSGRVFLRKGHLRFTGYTVDGTYRSAVIDMTGKDAAWIVRRDQPPIPFPLTPLARDQWRQDTDALQSRFQTPFYEKPAFLISAGVVVAGIITYAVIRSGESSGIVILNFP